MSAEAPVGFDRALGAVADGMPVDWQALERLARDDQERERVRCLRLLGEIGDLHRSTEDPLEASASAVETLEVDRGPTHTPRWGRYHLVEKVGAGGFGQVYRAWDPSLEREVAIKILHAHITDASARERLEREGKALARIDQRNVVTVHGVEVHEGRAALCMAFVRGQTLDDLVRARGPYSAREAAIIGEDVCRALAAVHRAGYLHRDVKARNVMREQAGRNVLMDFGTGREERAVLPGGDLSGTPLYMAPEVLAGRPASVRSDVYSVGVLLFYLVSGAFPVQARSTSELKAAHRDGRRRFLGEVRSDLPASFVRIVERALAPNPDDRYQSAGAVLDAFGDVLSEPAPPPAHGWLRLLLTIVPAAMLSLVALGALTSVAFNTTLGRSEFASETLWDRTYWGLKLAVPPVFVLLIGWLAQSVLLAFWRVAAGLSARARRLDERMRTRIAHATRDPAMLFSGVLILAAIALVASWIHFRPLLVAMTSFVRFAPADSIAILGPDYDGHHDLYTFVFSVLIAGTTAAWLIVSRIAARQRIAISRNLLAGGIVVLCLQVASLAISYRLLVHNTAPAVRWSGETCYVTGERDDRWLLFCPARDTDRNQVVRRGDPLVVDLGRQESLFTGIGGSRAASGS